MEFASRGDVPAVHAAGYVKASAADVLQNLLDARTHTRFFALMDSTRLHHDAGSMAAYQWQWRQGELKAKGETVLTRFVDPTRVASHGGMIELKHTQGDIGKGRVRVRVLPAGAKDSLIVVSNRVDLREGSYIGRSLTDTSPSLNRSLNISLALATISRLQKAFGMSQFTNSSQTAPLSLLPSLGPLLRRGDLLWTQTNTLHNSKVFMLGRTRTTQEKLLDLMEHPESFAQVLMDSHQTKITHQADHTTTLHWQVDGPLFGTEGVMRLTRMPTGVSIEATHGSMKGGHWRFESLNLPWGEAALWGEARFDPSQTSWFISEITQRDPSLLPGIRASSQILALRAIRSYTRSH